MAYFYKDQRLTHMGQLEANIWTHFLEAHGPEFTGYEYDVHLQKPVKLPDDMEAEYKADALALSALRIDVKAEDKKQIYLFEVRPNANQAAIGQLILYRYVYILQYNPTKPVRMMLVTDVYKPDIELTARSVGIGYHVF